MADTNVSMPAMNKVENYVANAGMTFPTATSTNAAIGNAVGANASWSASISISTNG